MNERRSRHLPSQDDLVYYKSYFEFQAGRGEAMSVNNSSFLLFLKSEWFKNHIPRSHLLDLFYRSIANEAKPELGPRDPMYNAPYRILQFYGMIHKPGDYDEDYTGIPGVQTLMAAGEIQSLNFFGNNPQLSFDRNAMWTIAMLRRANQIMNDNWGTLYNYYHDLQLPDYLPRIEQYLTKRFDQLVFGDTDFTEEQIRDYADMLDDVFYDQALDRAEDIEFVRSPVPDHLQEATRGATDERELAELIHQHLYQDDRMSEGMATNLTPAQLEQLRLAQLPGVYQGGQMDEGEESI